jgi:hypothetical protein
MLVLTKLPMLVVLLQVVSGERTDYSLVPSGNSTSPSQSGVLSPLLLESICVEPPAAALLCYHEIHSESNTNKLFNECFF